MGVWFFKLSLCLIFLDLLHSSTAVASDDFEIKLRSLFEGIMIDPKYNQSDLKLQIDKLILQSEAYMSENLRDQMVDAGIGESFIESIQDVMTIPAAFPTVLHLFELLDYPTTWSISLQVNEEPQNKDLMLMVLREYDEMQDLWITRDAIFVKACTKLEIEEIDGVTFVFLLTNSFNEQPQINMYSLSDSRFFLTQTSSVGNIDLFTIWDEPNSNNVYLAVLSSSYYDQFFCSLNIYQWDNSNFALFDLIPIHCATAIKSFSIDSATFLVVCHRWDVSDKIGAGNHTTLFKFNEELQSFEVHQVLSMSNCSNIEHFEYKSKDDSKSEQFLVFVGFNGAEQSNTVSMIYKLYDELFYPFQMIWLDFVQQWMTYESAERSVLLAATKYSGIHLFEYNGRRFSRTDIILESALISHISKGSMNGTETLVLADRDNDGTQPNVFQIQLVSDEILNDIRGTYDDWYSEMTNHLQSMDHLEHLEARVRSAPRVDSSEISIDGTLDLTDLKSDLLLLVQPEQDSPNDTREEKFAAELETALTDLKTIETFVNKMVSGGGKFFVNGDLFLNDFVLNCFEECDLNILSITNLNGEDFDKLLANTVNIDDRGSFETSLEFENIAVSLNMHTQFINGHPMTSLLHKKRDSLFKNGLKLDSIVISDKLSVKGMINGIKMDSHSVMLVSGNQTLKGSLIFKEGIIDNLYCIECLKKNISTGDCQSIN